MDDGAMLVYKILNTDTWLMIKDSVESFIFEYCFVTTLIEIAVAENNLLWPDCWQLLSIHSRPLE